MKFIPCILLIAAVTLSCGRKKTETTTGVADTVAVDTVLATSPAPADLAFNPIDGFSLKSTLVLKDTLNYFLFTTQDEFNGTYAANNAVPAPDFVINYIVAIAGTPTSLLTTMVMDSVETGESTIDVYVTIRKGEKQKAAARPSQLFAIERRDGYIGLQFYINGKKDQVLMLPIE